MKTCGICKHARFGSKTYPHEPRVGVKTTLARLVVQASVPGLRLCKRRTFRDTGMRIHKRRYDYDIEGITRTPEKSFWGLGEPRSVATRVVMADCAAALSDTLSQKCIAEAGKSRFGLFGLYKKFS